VTSDAILPTASAIPRNGSIRGFVARHRLKVFFTLAYLFSWYPWLIALARGKSTGPNPLGPFIAAILVLALTDGWRGVRSLLTRIVRGGFVRWYAVVFGLPFGLCLIAVCLTNAFGFHSPLPASSAWRELPVRFIFIILFIALGEEPGWRGYALPELQRRFSPFWASVVLAFFWRYGMRRSSGTNLPGTSCRHFCSRCWARLSCKPGSSIAPAAAFSRPCSCTRRSTTVSGGLMLPLLHGSAVIALWWTYAILWLVAG
jgi:membrane protease YdiL (CAAX protease family)